MLELVLVALFQFNSIFVGVDAAANGTGGTGWGEGQVNSTTTNSVETGGTGWGEGQVTGTTNTSTTSQRETGGTGWGEGQ